MTTQDVAVTAITTGDLIKAMSIIALFLSGVLGLVVKLVMNGTSGRTKNIQEDGRKLALTITDHVASDDRWHEKIDTAITRMRVDIGVLKDRSDRENE